MVGTGKLFPVLCYKYRDIWVFCTPQNQHFHFSFRHFASKIAISSKSAGERSHLVHFGYCRYVIKYLTRDMMDYHCLRVFRSRDRRIGKHSPGFSVFRTIVYGCSDPEPSVFRSRTPSWRSFLLTIKLKLKQVTYEV